MKKVDKKVKKVDKKIEKNNAKIIAVQMDKPRKSKDLRGHAEQSSARKAQDKAVAEATQEIKLKGPVRSKLIGDKVMVEEDYELFLPFYDRSSFGEIHGVKDKRIELGLSEALYLMERGKLSVFSGKKVLDLDGFVRLARKSEKNFWTRYRV
ncbi:hypothetical protein HN924_02900, partial [Candidatus Woesearchaeota archaeon]|nr:hypothetical protein [Candidatus Woesearchaeota archaeon]